MKTRLFSFFCFACLLAFAAPIEAALTPARLRCEYAVNPTGIDTPRPRLYWTVESSERGQRQSAYQVLVASSEELLTKDAGDLWDSGKVNSDETAHVRYTGKDLRSSQQVFWKVRVWDKDDQPSAWSAVANWTMGIVRSNDWHARWIVAPAATEALLLRKEFNVKPNLVRAIAHVTGLGHYEMTINGVKAGDDLLSPGWTDYNDTILYDTRDITALLKPGANAVGLALGNGMYNVVRRHRFVKFTGSFGALRAICQIELTYADGSREFVGTDDTWRTHAGPIVFSSIYGGEDFDARLAQRDCDQPGFDDTAWRPAVHLVRPPGTLRGHSYASEPLRVIQVHKPVRQYTLANGDITFDFGQNASHMPRIRVTGPAGSVIRLIPSEIINPDGAANQRTMGGGSRGSSWWEYTKGTDGEETWTPKFCYIGCRYMQARLTPPPDGGEAPKITSIEALVVHSIAEPVGEFECSNELLNRIRSLVRWAQRANMVSVLTDCPHREKLGWLEQYHLNGPSIRYEFDMARMFTKGMNDMANSQLRNGLVPNIAPEYTVFDGTFRAAAEWGSAFIVVPWQQYLFNADLDLIRERYDAMKRYLGYLESISTNDIVSEGLGDWYDLVPGERPGAAKLTLPPVTATAFYYYDAFLLSQMAKLLGRTEDAAEFAAKAERIRASFNREFYNEDKGWYGSGSQTANALPLVMGIARPEHRAGALQTILRDLESREYGPSAGDVGFRYLLQALAQSDRSDAIYRMINQDSRPGYGYQLARGATSLTEAWDANANSSHNHFMLGQVIERFYKDLA
ncbi:MAG TPA: family 78 glycoside hydrolase catalytic domain, partial [Verrucomicrobiota bacterium]|nr:family 78 glycoside hydrolase catalytic domain [Verrucomicrobiota bacterium]